MQNNHSLNVMLKQRAKTAQTPKTAVGQRVIINKPLQHSDNRRPDIYQFREWVRGMVLKPVGRPPDYFLYKNVDLLIVSSMKHKSEHASVSIHFYFGHEINQFIK